MQLALRAPVDRLKQARDFDVLLATEIVIESRHHHLQVATDGEITDMKPPLHYRIRPARVTVLGAVSPDQPQRREGSFMRNLIDLSDLHFGCTDPALIEPCGAFVTAKAHRSHGRHHPSRSRLPSRALWPQCARWPLMLEFP